MAPGDGVGSLWETTAPPAPDCPPLEGEHSVDVAIVGAGYTGLSTALHLAESGAGASIVVLEAHQPGWGASGRNNGQVIPTLTRPDPDDLVARFGDEQGGRFVALVRDSAALVFELIRRHGLDCEAVQSGWAQPAHTPGRVALSERRFEQWHRHGAPVELLDRDAASRLLGSEVYYGGFLNRSGGHINPLAYARGLARAALGRGVAVHGGSPVTGLGREAGRSRLATPQGAVSAEQVVVATAAYGGDLLPELNRSVVPVRSYQMATGPLSDNLRKLIVPGNQAVSDTRGDLRFFRYDRDGRLVTGGSLVVPLGDEVRLRRLVGRRLSETFPQLDRPAFEFVWSGDFAVTPDRLPRLHKLGQGLWSWIGCQGRGVALSTAMGGVLADAVRGRDPRELPLPVETPRPIPLHAVAARLAPLMLVWYRYLDRRG